jgi:hypothetical protein
VGEGVVIFVGDFAEQNPPFFIISNPWFYKGKKLFCLNPIKLHWF